MLACSGGLQTSINMWKAKAFHYIQPLPVPLLTKERERRA